MKNNSKNFFSTLFLKWFFNHSSLVFFLPIYFIFQLTTPAFSENNNSSLVSDTLQTYVTNQLEQAFKSKNKGWSETISITSSLLENPSLRSNDSLFNYVKYRHSLYLLMADENIKSREIVDEILGYYKKHDRKKWTNLKSRLVTLSIRLGEYDVAQTHIKEALPFTKKLNMPITEGLLYLGYSTIFRFKSDFGDAFRKAEIALKIFQKIDRKDWILEAQTSLAYISVLAKDYEGAELYFKKIFNSEEAVTNANFLVSPKLYSGIMNFEKGNINLAKKQMQEGIERINLLGSFPDLTIVYQYMSQISSIEKDYVLAADYIHKAIEASSKSKNRRQELSAKLTLIKLESITRPQKDNLLELKKIYQWALDNDDNILLKESSGHIASYYSGKGNFKSALDYNNVYINASEEKFQKDRLSEIALIKEKSKYAQEVKEREIKAQKLQSELLAGETRRNMMLGGIFFLVFMSGFLLYFYSQKQTAYSSLKTSNKELKKAELGLEHKNKELEKYIAYNLQLENFAYIASHDLKSPLQTISNFSQFLQKTADDRLNKEELQALTFISKGTDDMLLLVNDLLDFSVLQKSTISKEKIDVSKFVNYVLQLNQTLIEKKNAEVSLNLRTPYISGDRSKLLQLLQNLITNSVKFQRKNEPPKVEITSYDDKDNWVFNVKDNGIGIEPTYFNKIFLLFKRLHRKEDYEGTGIGLSMCKKIVDMHGGKIWVNSTLGKGSTFSFSIPKTSFGE